MDCITILREEIAKGQNNGQDVTALRYVETMLDESLVLIDRANARASRPDGWGQKVCRKFVFDLTKQALDKLQGIG